jgi:hypothetical protein
MPNQLSKLGTSGLSAVAAAAINGDVAVGLIATGSTQATAFPLPAANNFIATAAASTGVLLPVGNGGDELAIFNGGANALAVYPPVGATLNGGATNAAVSVPTLKSAYAIYASPTQMMLIVSA